ncbi:MAG: P-II family nitrogen regulator [Deltaproteobacteria bacterium]|nr:P-II family nitrogen regulator [Deltaproteobacteria bacterium]
MEWKKVVAIIRGDKLREVEERLKDLRVSGISVTPGTGYGEYANLFTRNWCVTHARLEIYCEASRVEEIAQAIMDTAHTGAAGDGMVAIIPVERMYRIRSRTEAKNEEG